MTDSSVWLHCTLPKPDAEYRLVCFPHAGGSASFFRDWAEHLPGVEVHAVRYPGRAERVGEAPPAELRELAGSIAESVATLSDRPLLLFGHSMGAAVALETARALEARGVSVGRLFASGSRDAACPEPAEPDDIEDDADTVRRLLELGGTDPELAADPDFQELVLPYVRADSRMFHDYEHRREPTLNCPVTTIVGAADAEADRRPWSELTAGGFDEVVVEGAHFYLIDQPPHALLLSTIRTPAR